MYMQLIGATLLWWINCSPCKPAVTVSIPGFSSLSDETLCCGFVAVGEMLNKHTHMQLMLEEFVE